MAQRPTILIVDDHPTTLKMLSLVLKGMDVNLIEASNGLDAIEAARTHIPTVILLDIIMPDIDGFQVLSVIKQGAQTASIPVIFLSGVDDSESKIRGLKCGAVDFINKPFNAEEVRARVSTHIKIRELEQALIAKNISLEDDYQRLVSTINEGLFSVDTQGIINYANPYACTLTGYSVNELTQMPVNLLFDTGTVDSPPPYKNVLEKHQSVNGLNTTIRHKQGSQIDIRFSCSPKLEDNQIAGAVMVVSDRTDEVAQERALESTREELRTQRESLAHIERLSTMGEMAAGFAHEVNQPLTAIANYTALSQRLLDNPEKHDKLSEVLTKINAQAIRASDVIARLRGFVSKPTQSALSRVSTTQLINDVMTLAEVDAKNNRLSVRLCEPLNEAFVRADAIELQQVLLNLVRNALEATADNGSMQPVQISSELAAADGIKISVQDDGPGISDEVAQSLFHPFFTTKTQGMGIGLSVCKTIVENYGGEIGFERPMQGAVFYIKLPIEISA